MVQVQYQAQLALPATQGITSVDMSPFMHCYSLSREVSPQSVSMCSTVQSKGRGYNLVNCCLIGHMTLLMHQCSISAAYSIPTCWICSHGGAWPSDCLFFVSSACFLTACLVKWLQFWQVTGLNGILYNICVISRLLGDAAGL